MFDSNKFGDFIIYAIDIYFICKYSLGIIIF